MSRMAGAWNRFADWVGENRAKSIALLALISYIVVMAVNHEPSPDRERDTGSATAAVLACQDFVEQSLRAPATAEFPPISEASVSRSGSEWIVSSHVDSENGFGAFVRTNWTCEARYEGEGRWSGVARQRD